MAKSPSLSPSPSSLDEKEKENDFGLVDPQAAAENPTAYEPIRSEPQEKIVGNGDNHSSKGRLSTIQSTTISYSETSDA